MSNTFIKLTEQYGRGVYAESLIQSGDLIFHAEILALSVNDTTKVNETDLQYYTFKLNETQDCLVLGDGEIFNHSDIPNVSYNLVWLNNRQVMIFRALKDIQENEQLFINYSSDVKVDASAYNVNLI